MKAILNVQEESAYSHLNGLTFTVKEVLNTMVGLTIDERTTDFSFTEIIIVDFNKEIVKLYQKIIQKPNDKKVLQLIKRLEAYAVKRNIKFTIEKK